MLCDKWNERKHRKEWECRLGLNRILTGVLGAVLEEQALELEE